MKKLIALLLAFVLVCSLIPMSAFADTNGSDGTTQTTSDEVETKRKDKDKDKDKDKHKDKHKDKYGKGKHKKHAPDSVHAPNQHSYSGYGYNTKYHWLECACGCQISMEPHVDPKDASDDYCTCGYHFSDNADLVTLWVKGCPGIKNFNKNVTEYTLNAYTYKDIKEIKISTRTFDSEATVELPDDLTLKEGENKFEVKVISENQKVTKVYTLIINKEAKK